VPRESSLEVGTGWDLGTELDSSAGAVSGVESCAPGRGLGGGGGGTGRVADGASGISSGFCCALPAPTSRKINARAINPLVLFAIPESLAFLVLSPTKPVSGY